MNRSRGGPSRATPQTLCQKCLKKGHYSYECKAAAQQRPYVTRPSRTQQLANPELIPKLSSDTPNNLLRNKGVADEELAKIKDDRKRKTKDENFRYTSRNRSTSTSSRSLTSVSTISTDMSRSPSSERERRHMATRTPQASKTAEHSRRKSSRRSSSGNSISPYHRDRAKTPNNNDEDIGLKQQAYRSNSRRRGRGSDREMPNANPELSHKRMRPSSSSTSHSTGSSYSSRRRRQPIKDNRRTRARRSSMSPDVRGRDRWSRAPRTSRRSRSRTTSMDRSRIARERRSMTPGHTSPWDKDKRRGDGLYGAGHLSKYADHDRYGSNSRGGDNEPRKYAKPVPPARKERSLSPFSKRIALTQAMNMGK